MCISVVGNVLVQVNGELSNNLSAKEQHSIDLSLALLKPTRRQNVDKIARCAAGISRASYKT